MVGGVVRSSAKGEGRKKVEGGHNFDQDGVIPAVVATKKWNEGLL